MCGIAGIITFDNSSIDENEIELMTQALEHRGPDSFGYYKEDIVMLGSRRLSIQGVQNGNQPVYNENGQIIAVYNGEIYNFCELRNEMHKRGHLFKTSADTEVLVHMYEEYGDQLIKQLEGQFAFAIWDRQKRHLILGRDRSGICPLYYAEINSRIYFSSEIKSMSRLSWFQAKPDRMGIIQALTTWSTIAPRTIFEQVSMLPRSHYLKIYQKNGFKHTCRYFSLPQYKEDISVRNIESAKRKLRVQVQNAVNRRLVMDKDVGVGAYISGGLDSTIIAYSIKEAGKQFDTFSVEFDDTDCDESAYQDICVKQFGSHHNRIHIHDEDIAKNLPKVLRHTEFPFFRTAPVPMFILSEAVHQSGIKVILSGEGADENFYGYDSFKDTAVLEYWCRNPESTKRPQLFSQYHKEIENNPLKSQVWQQYYSRFLDEMNNPFLPILPKWENGRKLLSFLNPEFIEGVDTQAAEQELFDRYPEVVWKEGGLKRCQAIESELLLSGYLLSSQGDRVLYANSVEGRYPFLDERLIKFVYNLPDMLKLNGMTEKYILKEAYKGLIPEEIRVRRKYPYHAQNAKVLLDWKKKYSYIGDWLSEKNIKDLGIFDYSLVGRILKKYENTSLTWKPTTRENLLLMFMIGTQGVFDIAKHQFIEE